jgi:hypothetical protein
VGAGALLEPPPPQADSNIAMVKAAMACLWNKLFMFAPAKIPYA